MASAALVMGAKSPVEQINDTLRGSVVDVLRVLIPTLAPYSNEEAFNVVLNSPEMTARSFKAFREHPEAFAHLLRSPSDQPVTNDNERLSCGRTLAQVISLVVQAVAKRYFRAKFSVRSGSGHKSPEQEQGIMEKLVALLKPARQTRTEKKLHPSDPLFIAMRDYLLYEWQLRLIPHYVGLPVSLVTNLGARILEFREIEDIQVMARTGVPLLKPSLRGQPLPTLSATKAAASIPRSDSVELPYIPVINTTLPEGVDRQRFVTAVLGRVNAKLARRLIQDLGLNAKQLAVMLIRAYEVLPSVEFQRFGAAAPDSHEANRFIAAALTSHFGITTDPATCTEFARLYMANVRSAV